MPFCKRNASDSRTIWQKHCENLIWRKATFQNDIFTKCTIISTWRIKDCLYKINKSRKDSTTPFEVVAFTPKEKVSIVSIFKKKNSRKVCTCKYITGGNVNNEYL